MANNKDASLIGLIEIPIHASKTGPTKRLVADLKDAAIQVNRIKNAVVRAWLRWREDHPEWTPPIQTKEDGTPKLNRSGEPYYISPIHPICVAEDGSYGEWKEIEVAGCKRKKKVRVSDGAAMTGFETYLYHHARAVAPNIDSQVVVMSVKAVLSNLSTKISHHHGGRFQFRWQAILDHAEQAPTFRGEEIYVPNSSSMIVYNGRGTPCKVNKQSEAKLKELGQHEAVLCFPLHSGSSGREVKSPIVSLRTGWLSAGNRDLVKKVASGEVKFSDSKIAYKETKKGGRWVFQLTFKRPGMDLVLDKERTAFLWPQLPEAKRPFLVEFGTFGNSWLIGNGDLLKTAVERVNARRFRIRDRYKDASSGVKGHGRKRFEMRLKPWARKTKDLQRHFTRQIVADVIRFCKRNNCGTVVYREPHVNLRSWLWLDKHDVPYDWTSLGMEISYRCRLYGIEFILEPLNRLNELRERFGANKKPGPARNPKEKPSNGVATNGVPHADVAKLATVNRSRNGSQAKRKPRLPNAGGATGT